MVYGGKAALAWDCCIARVLFDQGTRIQTSWMAIRLGAPRRKETQGHPDVHQIFVFWNRRTPTDLRNMLIFFLFFAIIIDKHTSHTKIWYNGRMFFLILRLSTLYCEEWKSMKRTEYSQRTKLDVSRRLRSLVLRNPSPTLPPLPSFRPALSFFFLAVRTLENRSSILDGNWRAGRWKERASCLDKRVLYWSNNE